MTKLSVNVNKVAWIRNGRGGALPDIREISKICIEAGCHGITVHPRDDMRHITPDDVETLKELTESSGVEFNIEGNPFAVEKGSYPGFLRLIKIYKPTQCTLVPDDSNQLTSDHGWDLSGDNSELKEIIEEVSTNRSRVCLFTDTDKLSIEAAKEIGADRVELYTGPYAKSFTNGINHDVLDKYSLAEKFAHSVGLKVNAGHDLNLINLRDFLSTCLIEEVSIGHALISDALEFGIYETVKKYLKICN
ncbi:MAG: pyridoxine 5'-phosphate synthase [Gammaproteobacteria bacterium]|nr:pyridoxine 5'-phosphate synthase [Gammaproteobacteria bacterium]